MASESKYNKYYTRNTITHYAICKLDKQNPSGNNLFWKNTIMIKKVNRLI